MLCKKEHISRITRRMSGQASILEYALMTFFVLVVIIGLIIFLSYWQITQLGIEETKTRTDRVLFLTKHFLNSQQFVKRDSMFDDGKLTALVSLPNACEELQKVFGLDWFAEIRVLDGSATKECTWTNYPDCNSWSFCVESKRNISYVVPTNIYRRIGYILTTGILGRTDTGTLEVGVYV